MANVGLTRPGQKAETAVDNTFVVSVVILMLVGVVYGGVFFFAKSLQARSEQIMADSVMLQEQLSSPETLGVADFARRSEETASHMKAAMIPSEFLGSLEGTVLGEVTIKSLDYDDGKNQIELTAVTGAVKDVARQMVAFKQDFSDVSAKMVGLNSDGDVEFKVFMNPAKQGSKEPSDAAQAAE